MKKKFGIILAILLCVVLVFTFVACGNKDSNTNNPEPDPAGKTDDSGITATQKSEMEASISAYLDKWLLANAQDEVKDQQDLLSAALEKVKSDQFSFTDKDMNEITPNIQVTFDAATSKYSIVFSWNKNTKQTFVKEAKTVNYTNWAGKMNKPDGYDALTEEGETAGAIDKIVNALFSTVNRVGTNGQTAQFGVDGKFGIEIMGDAYMLHVKGNIDLESAENTEIALMIEDEESVLGGLYYQGAATEQGCKLILQYGNTFKYIDYAALNKLLGGFIDAEDEAGEDFLPTGTLKEVLESFGVDGSASALVTSFIDLLAQGYVQEDTANKVSTYLVDINLSSVLTQASEMLGDLITPEMLEGIPFLQDLDIATMHGLLGHITIAATAKGEDRDELTDFEFAVNLPECTFYLNEDETNEDTQFSIPSISFSIFINDFNFITTGKIQNVIPEAAEDAEYFSPTNFDIGGDIYLNNSNLDLDDTFRFNFVLSANPFKPSQIKTSLTIEKSEGRGISEDAENFLTVTYEQSNKTLCLSGTVLGMEDNGEAVYSYNFENGVRPILAWLGLDNWQGIELDENGVITLKADEDAKPAMKALLDNNLAKAILAYYGSLNAQLNEETATAEEEDGFSVNKIGEYVDAFKALFDDLSKNGVINFDAQSGSGSIVVTPDTINQVTAAINALSILPMELPTNIEQPEFVKAYFNTPDYQDKLFVTVKVDDVLVEVTFDGSKDNEFSVTVKVETADTIYTCVCLGEDRTSGSFTITFDVDDKATGDSISSTELSFSNFHFNWGARNEDKLNLFTADEIAQSSSVFDDNGVATNLLGVIVDVLNEESIAPTVENAAKYIIDMMFGLKDFDDLMDDTLGD